ncbi:beta-galactosidase [Microbacterium aurantiacum]|uniref:beta-galactosidase n=1 Tax=Microbacterium aurantiacum TaxID=162393 RepID=UPI000C8015FF|nr:beta-galactosidase [Microbacterium aurantiacum]
MSTETSATGAFGALTAERGICFGGDYNPEQWDPSVWREDVELMRQAGVNLVTVGVFSWARIEPAPGVRDFAWLDEVLGLLHEAGIAVDLATPTASPPPWLGIRHPETLPVDRDGVRLVPGSRNQFTPASRIYREHALAITRDIAERYAAHPAVRMWHIGNEFGQLDFGDEAAREFRRWLMEQYGSIDALNTAWGTAFWSQHYADFDEILPPRRAPYLINPTQALDFRRFISDLLRDCYRELRDAVREAGATQPVTTNFMGFFAHVDYWSWADDLDLIADDQYPDPADPRAAVGIALVQDLMRSLGGGRPWMLMEQATSALMWREHNLPKTPQRARRDSLQAVARGADGVAYFQWRASSAGAERFHAAMLPHAGADTDLFRGVCRQGQDLRLLRPVVGATVDAEAAIVFDWSSWWASEEPGRPTERLDMIEQITRWYDQLWRRGIAVDLVEPGADLDGYRLVLAPQLYITEPDAAAALERAVERGAHLVVGPFSGVADRNAHVLVGRSPVLLRDVMGVSGEEWCALPDENVELVGDWWAPADGAAEASILGERLRTDGADVLLTYADGDLAGLPAVARNTRGDGVAWHVGAVVSDAVLSKILGEAAAASGVRGAVPELETLPDLLEAVQRGPVLFLLNHGVEEQRIPVRPGLVDLLTSETADRVVTVPPGDVRALIERADS